MGAASPRGFVKLDVVDIDTAVLMGCDAAMDLPTAFCVHTISSSNAYFSSVLIMNKFNQFD